MKVDTKTRDVVSTLQGERVAMGIDESAVAHIMTVLTDLYSDEEMAVIREYSTNAYDAHVESGVTRPIEITLPTKLAPFFKVRDFGTGLDAEDIRNIYSRYGTSTKRHTNDLVGQLGLGCKSALTYTDQFTLNSVKDGVCTQVSISRDENGAGVMTIVASFETDKESGTEIIVPVKQSNDFEEKANDFYRFWQPGTVLVNGQQPATITGLKLADDLILTEKERGVEQNYVVMGNVPYPYIAPDRYEKNYNVVAYVPIGAVNFTPAREELRMDKKTKDTIEAITKRVNKLKETVAQDMIDKATSKPEALIIAIKTYAMLRYKETPTFQGESLPENFEVSFLKDEQGEVTRQRAGSMLMTVDKDKRRGRKDGKAKVWTLPINVVLNSHFLVGYQGALDFTPTKRAKLDQWVSKQTFPENDRCEQFVLVDELQHAEWIQPHRIHQWAEVWAEKLPSKGTGLGRLDGRPSGSYRGYTPDGWTGALVAGEIDTSKPIYYTVTTYESDDAAERLRKSNSDAYYVELTSNREDKFKRDFPMAQRATEAIQAEAKAWVKSLSEEDLIVLKASEDHALERTCRALDPQRIIDPMTKRTVEIVKAMRSNSKIVTEKGRYNRYVAIPSPNHGWVDPRTKFPLLAQVSYYNVESVKEDLYLYMNAAYGASLVMTPAPTTTAGKENDQ